MSHMTKEKYHLTSQIQKTLLIVEWSSPIIIVGASKDLVTGVWLWDNGSPVNTKYFNSHQPDGSGNCLQIFGPSHGNGFDDFTCSGIADFVCEKYSD
ncbi:hypothetical protein EB796_020120 [Bugula neritina]|uniref:C-type lectin domain-containing protein n=1 Tax=Bugula neritina TaxID=10212 RepID=A0A7J7J867_BUGNE|nr:hypothetical protein EB796_020120 [Bugula neritina]